MHRVIVIQFSNPTGWRPGRPGAQSHVAARRRGERVRAPTTCALVTAPALILNPVPKRSGALIIAGLG
jgi:hypothetical protein